MELIARGGPLMFPIIGASILALAIVLERIWALRRSRVAPPTQLAEVYEALADHDPTGARAALAGAPDTPLTEVLLVGLRHAGAPRRELKERLEEVGQRVATRLGRGVGVVGVVASVEPLMGLLGTVLGMIEVFRQVSASGVGDPAALASGIGQALLTTAAGLIAAIPAYLAWRSLDGLVDRRVAEIEAAALRLLDVVAGPGLESEGQPRLESDS